MSQSIAKRSDPHPSYRSTALAHAWRCPADRLPEAATRRQLGTLDDRALADIGISRAQAQFVAEAPIWDVLR